VFIRELQKVKAIRTHTLHVLSPSTKERDVGLRPNELMFSQIRLC